MSRGPAKPLDDMPCFRFGSVRSVWFALIRCGPVRFGSVQNEVSRRLTPVCCCLVAVWRMNGLELSFGCKKKFIPGTREANRRALSLTEMIVCREMNEYFQGWGVSNPT